MKKKLMTQISKLAALTFAAIIVVSGSEAMTAHAGWDLNGNPTEGTNMAGEKEDFLTEEEIEEQAKANEMLTSDKYADVNTLNATVKISTNILKAKKKAGSYVKQLPKPSKVTVDNKALKINKDYTVTYGVYTETGWQTAYGLTSPGLYRIWIEGKNDYKRKGICTKRIYVYDTADKVKPMSSVRVVVNKMNYTGEAITENVIKSAKLGKTTLVEGKDYTVTYLNNVNSGTGIVRLTAVDGSGLVGEKEVNFTILGNKMNRVKVTGLTAKTYALGTEVTQDVTLTYNGTALAEGTDYTVKYMNNTKVGTAKVTFTGTGLYNGTLTKAFRINRAPLTADMVNEKDIEVNYTGKAVKPEVTLKNGGTDLKKGTDFTVAWKNNIKVGTNAQIIVTGKGNYTGRITVTFTIADNSAKAAVNKAASVAKPAADEGTAGTAEDAAVNETTVKSPEDEETTSDDAGETSDETADGTDASDETSDESADNTDDDTDTTVDTGDTSDTTDGNTETGDTTDITDTDDAGTDNADSTLSDDALTAPETQSVEETAIPENSVSGDADTNADAA